MSPSIESDILDVRFIRWPAVVVLIAHPMPAPERLRHLSTMATGELLQSDLTGRAKFVGANERAGPAPRAALLVGNLSPTPRTCDEMGGAGTCPTGSGLEKGCPGRYGLAQDGPGGLHCRA